MPASGSHGTPVTGLAPRVLDTLDCQGQTADVPWTCRQYPLSSRTSSATTFSTFCSRSFFHTLTLFFLDMHMTTTNADWKREYGLSQCGSLLDMVDTVSLGDIWADVVMGVPGSRLIIIKMVHFVFVRICNYFVNTIHVK